MKIAQVSPLHESVPPRYYGGTERIVSYLTEELVRMGHDVTLYASGDSVTAAKLRPMCYRALRLDPHSIDPLAQHMLMTERVVQDASQFDVIHSHCDYIPFSLFRRISTPHVTTLHGRLDIPDLYDLYREFSDVPLVSISDNQRLPLSWTNWQATVHHALPENLLTLQEKPGKYLAFLGRISPEKGLDRAIAIAQKAGMPLKIAAKVAKADKEYFDTRIRHLFDSKDIEYIGEINESDKQRFLGEAHALLFPIVWPEPFGLVMIEAMACGTPVIAHPAGSVPEVIEHGLNGFIARDIDDAAEAVKKAASLERRTVRACFERRFTVRRMAQEYLGVYERVIAGLKPQRMAA